MSKNLFTFEAAPTEWQQIEAAEGKPKGRPKFSMIAYTGAPVRQGWSPVPVVVDLAGIEMPMQKIPVRRDHMMPVGHTEMIAVKNGQLVASGVISFCSPGAEEIAEAGKAGFPWQASIAGPIIDEEEVEAGATAEVNGQTVNGPMFIVRKMRLKEISFVDLGADSNTSASIAAKALEKETTMEDSPEVKAAAERAKLAKASAELIEHNKKQVMGFCPKGLEAMAEKLFAEGKTVEEIRAAIVAEMGIRANPVPQTEPAPIVTATKPAEKPVLSMDSISDDDLASAF